MKEIFKRKEREKRAREVWREREERETDYPNLPQWPRLGQAKVSSRKFNVSLPAGGRDLTA